MEAKERVLVAGNCVYTAKYDISMCLKTEESERLHDSLHDPHA